MKKESYILKIRHLYQQKKVLKKLESKPENIFKMTDQYKLQSKISVAYILSITTTTNPYIVLTVCARHYSKYLPFHPYENPKK